MATLFWICDIMSRKTKILHFLFKGSGRLSINFINFKLLLKHFMDHVLLGDCLLFLFAEEYLYPLVFYWFCWRFKVLLFNFLTVELLFVVDKVRNSLLSDTLIVKTIDKHGWQHWMFLKQPKYPSVITHGCLRIYESAPDQYLEKTSTQKGPCVGCHLQTTNMQLDGKRDSLAMPMIFKAFIYSFVGRLPLWPCC